MTQITFITIFGGMGILFCLAFGIGVLFKYFIIKIFGIKKWQYLVENRNKIIIQIIGGIFSLSIGFILITKYVLPQIIQ